jgi:enamine deaminase RidA (YjgF/YER057c/UK114 family)
MTVHYINPPGLHKPMDNMYSHVSRSDGQILYRIGGQVAVDENGVNVGVGDMAAQLQCCYEMVTKALMSVGLTWRHVTHLYTFTIDMNEYMRHEQAIARPYFGDTPPPSTLLAVSRLVDPEWLVEVQADASS